MRRRRDFRIRPSEQSLEPPEDDEDVEFDDELRAERLDVEADRRHDFEALERNCDDTQGRAEMAADLEVDRRREDRLTGDS